MSKLSIIVPVYNEDRLISLSLPLILSLDLNKEVIVINDGSTDNILNILKDLGEHHTFKLINQADNRGKGSAIKKGLEEVEGDYFIICDADLEYDPRDIIYLFGEIQKIKNKKTVIYGSRFLNYRPYAFHYIVNEFLTFFTNLPFRSQLTDMETCFKLVPREALSEIKLCSKRFGFEPEITAQLLINGYQINERPISYQRRGYREGKKIKAKDGLFAVITLIQQRLGSL